MNTVVISFPSDFKKCRIMVGSGRKKYRNSDRSKLISMLGKLAEHDYAGHTVRLDKLYKKTSRM